MNTRATFAIISHPDAGKTTVTEKLLLHSGAIHLAGSVKARKSARHATSDWLALEKARGISVTTSVMQFDYGGRRFNLLDTPGHADFSEDTYRTLTAVDSALMVIDAVKGVESRTKQLFAVCQRRETPIITFINKCDRACREPLDLLDELHLELGLHPVIVTWPIGLGSEFVGVYHVLRNEVHYYPASSDRECKRVHEVRKGIESVAEWIPEQYPVWKETLELVMAAQGSFDREGYLSGQQTPVFFGSAMNQMGVGELIEGLAEMSPPPLPRASHTRLVSPDEKEFSAFVFKIQANMDPKHHDRLAFARICSGQFQEGMKVHQVRTGKQMTFQQGLQMLANERSAVKEAYPGDIIGIYNHGNIQIGDSFTQKSSLQFTGIPFFAPELFRRVVLSDPLKAKALNKGLDQLAQEGAVQVFRPLMGNEVLIGAIGQLQFDVVAYRLETEYQVNCTYEASRVQLVRWIEGEYDMLKRFEEKCAAQLARDGSETLCFMATSRVNLELTQERWPELKFHDTREYQG